MLAAILACALIGFERIAAMSSGLAAFAALAPSPPYINWCCWRAVSSRSRADLERCAHPGTGSA